MLYPDHDNQCNGDNPLNDDVRDREAPWRAEFQELQQIQQTMQQEIRQEMR
jgi:hypothetical protein